MGETNLADLPQPKRGQVVVFTKEVKHPGTKEKPFLRPSRIAGRLFVRQQSAIVVAKIAKTITGSQIIRIMSILIKGAAFATRRRARKLVPVDTSTLKRSINVTELDQLTFTVGTNVEYAAHVEFGTKPHTIKPKDKTFLRFIAKKKGRKRGRRRRRRRA